jgi:hypothetical protein
MRVIISTVGPLATASANNIALSQTPGAAGALTLNGSTVVKGVAVLDTARRVLITTGDTTHTFTVTGTTPTGTTISEVVGPITTSAYTAQDFQTVTSVTINGAATAAVTVGTNGVASTPWIHLDEWAYPQVFLQCDVTGTVNYTIQQTMDSANSNTNPVSPSAITWFNTTDTNGVNATASIQSSYAIAPLWTRVLLNSGTGSVVFKVSQLGAAPY